MLLPQLWLQHYKVKFRVAATPVQSNNNELYLLFLFQWKYNDIYRCEIIRLKYIIAEEKE